MHKRIKSFATLIIFSLILGMPMTNLFAQSSGNKAETYLTEDNEIMQRFTWKGADTVYRYEFLLEKLNDNNEYEYFDLLETKETEVSISLRSGKYRYLIKVYNYLNQMDFQTKWVNFEVKKVYQPVITSVTPVTIFLDEGPSGIFTINGLELREDTVYTLENNWYEISTEVLERDVLHERAKIKVNPNLLDTGTYYIRAVNEGGLFDTSGTIRVGFAKPLDVTVAAGWTGLYMLDKYKQYNATEGASTLRQFFNDRNTTNGDSDILFWPFGLNAKVTVIPYKTARFYLGAGLNLNATYLKYTSYDYGSESYTIKAPLYTAGVNGNVLFILKKRVPFRILADIHAGLGILGFMGLTVITPNHQSDPAFTLAPCLYAGADLQFFVTKKMFFTTGADFVWAITPSRNKETRKLDPMSIQFVRPSVSFGWMF